MTSHFVSKLNRVNCPSIYSLCRLVNLFKHTRMLCQLRSPKQIQWRWNLRAIHNYNLFKSSGSNAAVYKMTSHSILFGLHVKSSWCIIKSDFIISQMINKSKRWTQCFGTRKNPKRVKNRGSIRRPAFHYEMAKRCPIQGSDNAQYLMYLVLDAAVPRAASSPSLHVQWFRWLVNH